MIAIILTILLVTLSMTNRYFKVMNVLYTWNYYCYRYKHYCLINYSSEEKPECRINENHATKTEGLMIWLMIWKINPKKYFDFKPDFDDIYKYYIISDFE